MHAGLDSVRVRLVSLEKIELFQIVDERVLLCMRAIDERLATAQRRMGR